MRGLLVAGLCCALTAWLGCEAETPAPGDAAERTRVPAAQDRPGAPLRYEAGQVWIEARNADRQRVLWQLSEVAGFTLDVADLDPAPVSLSFEGAPLARVVAALAGELPFAIDYEKDAASREHEVVSIRVGVAREAEVVRSESRTPPPPAVPEADARRFDPERDRLLHAYDIANTDARRDLVEELEPVGVQLEVLSHVLRNDPDPEIRAEAASTLATAGSYGSVKTLIATLDAEDPAVLLEVIEALEFAGDESVVQELEPLFDHSDREVASAAREAADFLR